MSSTFDPYRPPPPIVLPDTSVEKNLRLLSIFHYVVGGLVALVSSLFLLYVAIGVAMLTHSAGFVGTAKGSADGPPTVVGVFFVVLGGVAVLLGWTMGALAVVAGRSIAQRRRHTLCIVVASLLCMFMPFGTLLGVFTLILLTKPYVRQQFASQSQ
jgi:hypothetical protein